ncbi:MAG: exodeoxyribonuclease VII small subunit [Gordonia sp. (in: high G+C Gram-positive bacteria)]|uniref:exodeoxyribonuclease VII small subunit n=1 Tax=Gordonia sp. (in: high G+C Gram-positive bacteria) TaxID=84139 RepID=UPI0039E5BFF8
MSDKPTPVDELGYEQARDELAQVVARLEQGGLGLDESLELWERGEQLAQRAMTHLQGARERIEKALDDSADVSENPAD